ncbi:MAG: serine/threonine-protein kinase [Planctomycetota bacterium]
MDKKLWNQVERIFTDAAVLEPELRDDFVRSRSNGNRLLQDEVCSLLACYSSDQGSTWTQPFDGAAAVVHSLVADVKGLANEQSPRTDDSCGHGEPPGEEPESAPGHVSADVLIERLYAIAPELLVKNVIRRGGTATVFRARRSGTENDVAVKVLSANVGDHMRQRFIAGARAVRNVRSPSIVRIQGVVDSRDVQFVVMDLVDGASMQQRLDRRQLPGPASAVSLAIRVAKGLRDLHEQDLVHLDVKPANILVANTGTGLVAQLGDFGTIKCLNRIGPRGAKLGEKYTALAGLGPIVGTPAYMSPEQLLDPDSVDFRSDIFGLGVTLYHMLSGVVPYRGTPDTVIRRMKGASPGSLRTVNPNIPEAVENVCLKAISFDPDRRQQTATALIEELAECYPRG